MGCLYNNITYSTGKYIVIGNITGISLKLLRDISRAHFVSASRCFSGRVLAGSHRSGWEESHEVLRDIPVISPIDAPWCWYIYLQNWVIFRANVGKYSIHGAYG